MPLSKIVAKSITDDTITTDQIADTSVHGRRNLIINGAMQVAQRGTSTTSAGYLIDRFSHANSGVSVTFSQESLTSSDTPYTYGFRKYARLTNTSVSSAANAYEEIQQKFEAQDIANSGWNYTSSSSNITLSFWVRSSLAGTYYSRFQTADGSQYLRYVEFTLAADTWKKVEFTTAGNSNLTVNNDNGIGLQLLITPYYGTNFTGGEEVDANDWYSRGGQADAYYPNYAQNWANTASATFDVTGVQVEVGEQATPFEHRSYGEELALCHRYYEKATSGNTAGMTCDATASVNYHVPFKHATEMRATPSYTWTEWTSSGFPATAPTFQQAGKNGVNVYKACSITGNGRYWLGYVTADAEL